MGILEHWETFVVGSIVCVGVKYKEMRKLVSVSMSPAAICGPNFNSRFIFNWLRKNV